jgi:hypothetical protein
VSVVKATIDDALRSGPRARRVGKTGRRQR